MRFEIVEYKLDKEGNKKISATYEVEQMELSKTIDNLEKAVKAGDIAEFEIAKV